ncbi:endonuclease domain-containing protein [Sphingomonas antarctica]|uniref:endonuclease domain-containing protein n=1 Tax=Sphingomonas antarctica TaxID=2040274 RepID=UPI0039E76D90
MGRVRVYSRDNPRPTRFAQTLRGMPTPAEDLLWRYLRSRRCAGAKCSRQIPVGPFVADFVCREQGLIVEVDGESHELTVDYDARRTGFLEAQGYRVVRFTNDEVTRNLDGVVRAIEVALRDSAHPGAARRSLPRAGRTSGEVHHQTSLPLERVRRNASNSRSEQGGVSR